MAFVLEGSDCYAFAHRQIETSKHVKHTTKGTNDGDGQGIVPNPTTGFEFSVPARYLEIYVERNQRFAGD